MNTTTLVIHPFDATTRFLELTYRGLDAVVVERPIETPRLRSMMEKADRIMMMGHGSVSGLFCTGRTTKPYVIDASVADLLRERDNNIFIWCYADEFMRRHRLAGFSTGMFISETSEASWFRVHASRTEIEESNHLFGNIVGRFATQPTHVLAAAVNHEYGRLAQVNPVARYNLARMVTGHKGAQGWNVMPLRSGPASRPAPVFTPRAGAVIPLR